VSGSLKRVLRVRALQEELAWLELEAETARLREFEQSAAQADCEARSSRERWFAMVEGEHGGQVANLHRVAEDAAWAMAVWRRAQAEAQRPAQEARVARARAEFLAGRRARMQLKTLVETEAATERLDRRRQQEVDDWFQSRTKAAATARAAATPGVSAKESASPDQF